MSYHRYNYTSPSGNSSYHSSSYTSPSSGSRYSSNYESSLSSGYGSGLGGYSGRSSAYGGSLGNLSSSRYGDYGSPGSSYSSSHYSPSSSFSSYLPKYSYDRTSKYDTLSSYTPRSDFSRSRPTSGYGSSSSKYRSSNLDTDTYSRPRKTRFADEVTSASTPKSKAAELPSSKRTDAVPKRSAKAADTSESDKPVRRRVRDEGSIQTPSAAPDADVAAVTRKTENLSVNNSGSQPRPVSPSFQDFGKQASESARYKEQVSETPQYRPYTNPNLQSSSFKTLQTVIDSGRDPGSFLQKAPWQSSTVNQPGNEPRKYTPSKTWAAVHADANNSGGRPGSGPPPAPQAGPYKPPPADKHRDTGYKPTSYNPPKPAGAPKPFAPSSAPPNKNTQAPVGDNVVTKGTSAINQQSANPDKTPVCARCDTDIRGPFVLALNKSWCPNHFTCSKCNSELVNMGFVELNGNIYCENDYENFFAPKCAKCRQAIIGDTVNALDKTWHPNCFVCDECGDAISSGAFHVEEGRPYCMKDWQRLFQTKCTGCSYPVEPGDKWIEALDANWHSECFVCGVCRTQLEGKPFYPRDGKPFCKEHAVA
ncbi:PDZ and LIM domain protein 7-like isoform X2 [Watersipora subatra]|uniref:PDZ and LIM domain protein 7-like isoform X2 n=1 Tax=Watersipora subatra TaxID=2589382 RepID=UPI00355BCDC0